MTGIKFTVRPVLESDQSIFSERDESKSRLTQNWESYENCSIDTISLPRLVSRPKGVYSTRSESPTELSRRK